MNELNSLLRANEPVRPTLYAYWDPNVLSSNNILGLFIEDTSNSPELTIALNFFMRFAASIIVEFV